MRLDLFLKSSRLVLRRSLAQELCNAGLIKVNGAVARPAREIKVGDRIEIKRRDRIAKIAINKVPESKQVSKSDAAGLYSVIEEHKIDLLDS